MGEIIAGSDKAEYDYHIFRYAEVLLVLAEATFEKKTVESAMIC